MSVQCDLHGIPFKRHRAVDGATHTFTDEEKQMFFGIINKEPGLTTKYTKEEANRVFNSRLEDPTFKKTKNIMACALSHIQVWKEFKDSTEPVFILEDDSVLDSQLRQNITMCIDSLNTVDPEWDIVWLSGNDSGNREVVASWGLYDVFRMDPPNMKQGTVGYILSPKGLKHFLKVLDTYGCSYASDFFLIENLDVKHAYGVNPPLLKNYSIFKSSITGQY